jgi:phosphopantetheinyl transferase
MSIEQMNCEAHPRAEHGLVLRLQGKPSRAKVWLAAVPDVFRLFDAAQMLSPAERTQARVFRLAGDRDRFLASRTLLRYALTETTDGKIPFARWRYREGPHGKPAIEAGLPPLEFNISHAKACVAVGISDDGPIGVDIESLAPEDCSEMLPDVLTKQELARLKSYERDRQKTEFVGMWTAKEACAKALGHGGAIDFARIESEPEPSTIYRLADSPQKFSVASQTVWCAGGPYRLSIAKIIAQTSTRLPDANFGCSGEGHCGAKTSQSHTFPADF